MGGVFINMVKKIENNEKIVKINLSKRFITEEEFKTLENRGFPVAWIEDGSEDEDVIYTVLTSEE